MTHFIVEDDRLSTSGDGSARLFGRLILEGEGTTSTPVSALWLLHPETTRPVKFFGSPESPAIGSALFETVVNFYSADESIPLISDALAAVMGEELSKAEIGATLSLSFGEAAGELSWDFSDLDGALERIAEASAESAEDNELLRLAEEALDQAGKEEEPRNWAERLVRDVENSND